MDEVEFFARISSRLGRSISETPPQREIAGVPQNLRKRSWQTQDTVSKFKQELEDLGGQVEIFSSLESMNLFLSVLLEELKPLRVGVWGGGFLDKHLLHEALSPYEVVTWGPHGVQSFEKVDISISGCAYAIADTGTLVMMSSEEHGRSVAVLPTVHIVIVNSEQIFATMGEVLELLLEMNDVLPSSVHFISGPSRSSDIENDQTIGIHGPARVISLVII